jgi:hypothetical protein
MRMGRQQPTWVVNLFVSEPLLKKTIELTVAQSKTYYVIAKKCSTTVSPLLTGVRCSCAGEVKVM